MLVDKTQQLNVEKNKADRLLSQMLPVQVIRQLKQQRQVSNLILYSLNFTHAKKQMCYLFLGLKFYIQPFICETRFDKK